MLRSCMGSDWSGGRTEGGGGYDKCTNVVPAGGLDINGDVLSWRWLIWETRCGIEPGSTLVGGRPAGIIAVSGVGMMYGVAA
jgi:hypothetical protein